MSTSGKSGEQHFPRKISREFFFDIPVYTGGGFEIGFPIRTETCEYVFKNI